MVRVVVEDYEGVIGIDRELEEIAVEVERGT